MTEATKVIDPLEPHETVGAWLIVDRANESAVVAGPFETSIEAIKAREEIPDWHAQDHWIVPERIFEDE